GLDGDDARAGAHIGETARRRAVDEAEERIGLGPYVLHVLVTVAELEHVEAVAEAANPMQAEKAAVGVTVDEAEAAQVRRRLGVDVEHAQPRRQRVEQRRERLDVGVQKGAQDLAQPRDLRRRRPYG